MTDSTIGSKLLALKARSGLSLNQIAKAGGFRSPSSIQRYFSEEYDPEHITSALAERLQNALSGYGDPPVTSTDIYALTEYGFTLDRAPQNTINIKRAKQSYVECYSSFDTGEVLGPFDIFVVGSEIIRMFNRPAHLQFRSIGGVFLRTISMMPRFSPGELVFFERERPAAIGQDIIVTLRDEDDLVRAVFGRFGGRSREGLQVDALNPADSYILENALIDSVAVVLTSQELLEQTTIPDAYA